MSILALDLSSKCSGWSIFSKSGSLLNRGRITPSPEINSLMKLHYITDKVKELYQGIDELVIEDIFLSSFGNVDVLKYLARLSGAIIYSWIVEKYKIPHFYMANKARPLAGAKGNSKKAEIQLFIIQKYKFANQELIDKYEDMILETFAEYKAKELKKGAFKYRLDKISGLIDEETGIGEDTADSIILGLAYCEEKNNEKHN